MALAATSRRGSGQSFELTEHAADMARQRGVSLEELGEALSNRTFVINNSKKDPRTDHYVMRFKDLRVIWEERGETIVVLTIFRR